MSSLRVLATLVVIASCLGLLSGVQAGCDLPALPTDLDLISTVESSDYREVHLHGMYRVGSVDKFSLSIGGLVHNLTLKYEKDTEFRLSLLPHNARWMKLFLVDDNHHKIVASSLHGSPTIEHMLFSVLKANVAYTVMVEYSLAWRNGDICPSVMMELAAQPKDQAVDLKGRVCRSGGATPDFGASKIRPPADANNYYEFNNADSPSYAPLGGGSSSSSSSSDDDTPSPPVRQTPAPRSSDSSSDDDDSSDSSSSDDDDDDYARKMETASVGSFTVIGPKKGTLIEIPHIPGRHQKWKFRMVIYSRFLDGGDVAAMLTTDNVTTLPEKIEDCRDCVYGSRGYRNSFILQEELWAGENGKVGKYHLWFLLRKGESDFKRSCAPYSVDIHIHPLAEQETFANCPYSVMPPTFNAPGYYNNDTGVMTYTDDILVNLTTRTQVTLIQTKKDKSILRLWISNHKELDVDLSLFERDHSAKGHHYVAASMAMTGPEGIVFELHSDKVYEVQVSIPYPHRESSGLSNDFYRFCDSFQLHAHIFPVVSSTGSCQKSVPHLGGIQENLNKTSRAEFRMITTKNHPFIYPLDLNDNIGQKSILTFDLYFKESVVFNLAVPSDNYGGRVQIQLWSRGDASQKLYSEQRGSGSDIFALLERGWYTIALVTPYMQIGTRKISEVIPDMPTCISYNLALVVNPYSSEKQAQTCLYPLEIPTEMHQGPHSHRHFIETYAIPAGGSSSRMKITSARHARILHFQVKSSTMPVSMFLTKGGSDDASRDNSVARSQPQYKGSSMSSLMYYLEGDQEYTVTFDFSTQAAEKVECQFFVLQQSVARPSAISNCGPGHHRHHAPPKKSIRLLNEGEVGPLNLPLTPPRRKEKAHGMITQVYLELPKVSNLRMRLNYNFLEHDFFVRLCRCTSTDAFECGTETCIDSKPYLNGVDLFAELIPAGNYTLMFHTWTHGLGHGHRDITRRCSLVSMQLSMSFATRKASAPGLCSSMQQYLPRTFNTPAGLNSHYHNEFHFQGYTLVSQQFNKDQSKLHIRKKSVVRAFVAYDAITTSIELRRDGVKGVGGRVAGHMGSPASFYVVVEPGLYQFNIRYFIPESRRDPNLCVTVPLELSVMEFDDLDKMAVTTRGDGCTSDPFPTTPDHHGHHTLYRPTGHPFLHHVDFNVGSRGGFIELDVRYSFQVAGLAVVVTGDEIKTTGEQRSVRLKLHYFSDRAFLRQQLEPGKYTIRVFDPVPTGDYTADSKVACTPYNIHMKFVDWAEIHTPAPHPHSGSSSDSDSSSSSTGPHEPTRPPGLQCDASYDTVPARNLNSASSLEFTWKSPSVRIPFENGEDQEKDFHGYKVHYKKSIVSAGFYVDSDTYVRAWVRSPENNFMLIQLFDGNSTQPLRTGKLFGWHTDTIVYRPGGSSQMRIEVQFHYESAPVYGVSYNTCEEKMAQTSFELFLAVIPKSRIASLTHCASSSPDNSDSDDGSSSSSSSSGHYPPSQVTLDKAYSLQHDYYFSRSDYIHSPLDTVDGPPGGHGGSYPGGSGGGGGHHSSDDSSDSDSSDDSSSSDDDEDDVDRRRQSPGATKSSVPHSLINRVTSQRNMTITIPSGTSNGRFAVQVSYNLHISNMRLTLHGTNQSRPLARSDGGPTVTDDEKYNARAELLAVGLEPGRYTLTIEEANAERELKDTVFCVPYGLRVRLHADSYADAPPPPFVSDPHVTEVTPGSLLTLDPSRPFRITLRLSEPSTGMFVKASGGAGQGQDMTLVALEDAKGKKLKPKLEYFVNQAEVVAVYPPHSLSWDVSYTLRVDGTALRSDKDKKRFKADVSRTYQTTHCACTESGKCAVGGSCDCTLASGDSCSHCDEGSTLSNSKMPIGTKGHRMYLCVKDAATAPPTDSPNVPTSPPRDDSSDYSDSDDSSDSDSTWGHHTPTPTTHAPAHHSSTSDPSVQVLPHPAFKWLRYTLSIIVVAVLFFYSLHMWVLFRQSKRNSYGNPFRRVPTGRASDAFGLDDDEEDDDENNAIVN